MRASLPALREAIRSNPHDAGLRAVFADLLLERNDPRGLFIQAQSQHREAEAAALLATYRQHFVHPLLPNARVTFVDGFIDSWATDATEFRARGRRFLRTFPLRALELDGARCVDLQYVLASEGFASVRELTLRGLGRGALALLARHELPRVQVLQVAGEMLPSELEALPDTFIARRLRSIARPRLGSPYLFLEHRFESPLHRRLSLTPTLSATRERE